MSGYENFNRRYRLIAGKAGKQGFAIGDDTNPLHISFAIQKSDLETQNTGKIEIWNLNKTHLAELESSNCVVALNAGYGKTLPLIFAGVVSFVSSEPDGADTKTHIEVVDNLIQTKETNVSVSYKGTVNWKTIVEDTAKAMGVAVKYSQRVSFANVSNGYSYVGAAKNIIDRACRSNGLSWSIQNGVLEIKKRGDTMSSSVYEISKGTGMIGSPVKVVVTDNEDTTQNQIGWDVNFFLNGAVNINDYVKLVSKKITGYFYVSSLQITGDNVSGDWVCQARLIELKK